MSFMSKVAEVIINAVRIVIQVIWKAVRVGGKTVLIATTVATQVATAPIRILESIFSRCGHEPAQADYAQQAATQSVEA